MIRSYTDYAQKAHIYFQAPSLRQEAFGYIEEQLHEKVRKKEPTGGAALLSNLKQFMERQTSLAVRRVDEGLQGESENFFIRNIDSLLKLCALATDPWERMHTLYLIIRFLPELEEKQGKINSNHLIQGYLLMIHTLAHPELFINEINGRENRGCYGMAIKGLFRWDGRDILKDWNTRPDVMKTVKNEIPEERKKHYPAISRHAGEIERGVRRKKGREEDILFLLFTTAELKAARLNILEKTGQDLLHENWEKNRENILNNLRRNHNLLFPEKASELKPVEEFIASRLKEAWEKADIKAAGVELTKMRDPFRTTLAQGFQGSRDSGTEPFSKEDADILRKLSINSPNSS